MKTGWFKTFEIILFYLFSIYLHNELYDIIMNFIFIVSYYSIILYLRSLCSVINYMIIIFILFLSLD